MAAGEGAAEAGAAFGRKTEEGGTLAAEAEEGEEEDEEDGGRGQWEGVRAVSQRTWCAATS